MYLWYEYPQMVSCNYATLHTLSNSYERLLRTVDSSLGMQ